MLAYQLFIATITGVLYPQLCGRKPFLAQILKGFVTGYALRTSRISVCVKHFFFYLGKAFRIQKFIFDFAFVVISEWNSPLKTTVFSFVNIHCVSHFCFLSDAWSDG